MSDADTSQCPTCGRPLSGRLRSNCPACLIQLCTSPGPEESGPAGAHVSSGAGRRMSDYELLEEIARGGMGAVFRARQVSLNRTVAVKLLHGGQFADENFIRRFRREAEAAASLSHPNLVSIYEVGTHDGQPFFSMELIEGRSLAELTHEHSLSARRAAQLVRTIAEAIHFAHERGLLHRDLKPSNVLVDDRDVPHVTDFGLAKRVEENGDLTLTGQVLGSPNYMPPEQADPQRGPATPASDVYSLGAILYHLLTGRPPFLAGTVTQTLRLVTESDPLPPRLLCPDLSRDLETICAKCLEKDPKRRYGSAQELADELGRFLRDEPIRARPISAAAKLLRWCRRKPALALAGALLLIVAIGSPIVAIRINAERTAAESAKEMEAASRIRAETAERATQQRLYESLLEQARATVLSGEMGHRFRALDAVGRAGAISNSAALRGVAIAAMALPDLRFERELAIPNDAQVAKLDPEFQRIAIAAGNGPIEIRSVSDGQLLTTLPPSIDSRVSSGLWSRDGRFFGVSRNYQRSRGADLEVWEVARAKRVLFQHVSSPAAFAFHPTLPRILTGEAPATAVIWNLETGGTMASHILEGRPRLLRFAPDGESFAASLAIGVNRPLVIHRANDGASGARQMFTNSVHEIAWHPDGRWIAVGDDKGAVHSMDSLTGETQVAGRHKSNATVLEFSPDGKYLFSGGWERELICWDTRTMCRAFTVALGGYHFQFRADGRQCAIARLEGPESRVRLHAFEPPALRRDFAEDLGGPRSFAAFSDDGRWLAACGDERFVVWDLHSGAPGATMRGLAETRVSFAANGELFVNPRNSGSRWRVSPGTNSAAPPRLKKLEMPVPAGWFSFCLASNGVILTGTNGSGLAALGSAEDIRWSPTISGLNAVSPDERWLGIFQPFSPHLYIHRLPDFERVAKLSNEFRVSHFEFSPLGDEVAVGNREGVEFWSTTTWQRTRRLTRFEGICYSPDARTFWLWSDYRSAGLHDARTAEPLLPLPLNTRPLAISRDGRHLATLVNSRHVQVWDLAEVRQRLGELGLDWSDAPIASRR